MTPKQYQNARTKLIMISNLGACPLSSTDEKQFTKLKTKTLKYEQHNNIKSSTKFLQFKFTENV